jgi:hypothetical protein
VLERGAFWGGEIGGDVFGGAEAGLAVADGLGEGVLVGGAIAADPGAQGAALAVGEVEVAGVIRMEVGEQFRAGGQMS